MERGGFERGPDRNIENSDLQLVRAVFDHVVTGTPSDTPLEQLEEILETSPQLDENQSPRYLLTSGLAVELITGYERDHHDLDLVIMNPARSHAWEFRGTDNVTPGEYWADMEFDPTFLADTRQVVFTRRDEDRSPLVGCVSPAIILVQKMSNCFGRAPRPRDVADSRALARYIKASSLDELLPIIDSALDALPAAEVDITFDRLKQLFIAPKSINLGAAAVSQAMLGRKK